MAWTLFEELLKSGTVLLVGLFLKGLWRGMMSEPCLTVKFGCRGMRAHGCRGLCLKCYAKAKKKVDDGETTWERLAEKGLALAQGDPFDDAYSKAMEDN